MVVLLTLFCMGYLRGGGILQGEGGGYSYPLCILATYSAMGVKISKMQMEFLLNIVNQRGIA